MLADVDQYARLMTAANGGRPDPLGGGWQRGLPQTKGNYAAAALIGKRLKEVWTWDPEAAQQGGLTLLQDVFDCLDVGDGSNKAEQTRRRVNPGMYPDGLNFQVVMRQSLEFEEFPGIVAWGAAHGYPQHPQKLPATNGLYDTVYNVVDGVITIKSNVSPHQAATRAGRQIGNGPRVQTWSDVTWWSWMDLKRPASKGNQIPMGGGPRPDNSWAEYQQYSWASDNVLNSVARGFLNYIIVEAVETPDTRSIIARCMEVPLSTGNTAPTFFIGSWCYYALLATLETQDIVQFLSQHKASGLFGHKVLESVKIYSLEVSISLLWAVKRAGDWATQMITQSEGSWLPPQLVDSHLTNIPPLPPGGVNLIIPAHNPPPRAGSSQQGDGSQVQEPIWEDLVVPDGVAAQYGYPKFQGSG